MKIFEYRPFLGTFSMGLERFSQNEVVEVVNLSKIAAYSYNNTHKQWFLSDFTPIKTYESEKDYDLAILNPYLGENIGRKGKNNFTRADLINCLYFLNREKPKFAIILADIDAIPMLNTAKDYVRDGFNQLSKDLVIYYLQKMGYKAHLLAIDEANYGIPIHKHIALYVATPKNFNFNPPEGLFTRYGRGKYNKYRTIADAIGDLGSLAEWSTYNTKAQNVYQRYIRQNMPKVTWHFSKRKLSKKKQHVIQQIMPGLNARKTQTVNQQAGYTRPKWDRICPSIDDRFYMVSSKYPCIHPIEDRPFTIREGMRIMGLPDTISFELKSSNREVAKIIVNSISPLIGEVIAVGLKAID